MEEQLPKKRVIQFSLMLFSAVMVISFSFYFYQVFFSPNVLVDQEEAEIYVPTGTDFFGLLEILDGERIVKDKISFAFVSKLMKFQQAVKPGHYLIPPNLTNIQMVRMLRGGMQEPIKVVLNNVRIPADLASKSSENLEFDSLDFSNLFHDKEIQNDYGFDSSNFLAMFLPNTYEMYWNVSPRHFIKKMNDEYSKFWNQDRKEKAERIGLNMIEVSVLASIVQAETNMKEEKPIIAGVYMNRLKRNMRLQADPTVVYAIGDFEMKRVLTVHKEIDSPYNTYKYPGLPPGPINLPEIETLEAVLNYENHNYLYFCAKEDFSGRHNFAATLSEHNANARKYQNALNKRRIYR